MRPDFLPLTTLALSIDLFWAIEPGWAMRAKSALDVIDAGMHTVEYAQRQGRARPDLAPRRLPDEPAARDDDDDDDDGDHEYRGSSRRRKKPEKPYCVTDGVAYLYLTGPLTKRPQSWGGGTSTIHFRRCVRLAVADETVRAILIVVDSPGGQVMGTCAAASDVAWAAKQKPTACYCDDMCCSAAYWIGCMARYGVFCNPTATVGSIGTISQLVDSSAAMEKAGIEIVVVSTGDRKGIGIPGAPVTEEHRAYLREYLDLMNAEFTGTVKRARHLNKETMADVMRAGLYVGTQAVEMGLCCAVKTLDAVHAMLVATEGQASARFAPLRGDGEDDPDGGVDDTVPSPTSLPPYPPAPRKRGVQRSGGSREAGGPESGGTNQPPPGSMLSMPEISGSARSGPVPDRYKQPEPVPVPMATGSLVMENKRMKQMLVRALTMLGLQRMAVAVVGATDETPEVMAQAMAGQVNAEVDERIAAHPLILQCSAAGIASATDFTAWNDMAILGRAYLSQLRTDAKAQANRAFGAEAGPTIGAQVDQLPASQVKNLLAAWSAQADATYGIGKDGSAAARVTAPKVLNESANATAGAEDAGKDKSAWAQLTASQQDYGRKLGMNTPEKRENFAKGYLDPATQLLELAK